jgi:hypothetical protein
MKRIDVRAAGGHGAYRARFVFPAAGRWTLAVRVGGSTSRLGSVQVRPPPVQPVAFTEPTSIDLEPGGTLLLVENNPGRVLRVDPKTGRVTVLVATTTRPYSIARAPSGGVFLSGENLLRRVDPNGSLTTVAQADSDIGPVAVAPDGDIFYTTETQIFRLAGGVGPPILVAAQLAGPHGLAVAGDGALLVSDTGNDRVRRIDRASGVITEFARIGSPRGIDVAADGTIYVIDSQQKRLVRLNAAGAPIGSLGPAFGDPYDVEVADSGVAYVLEGVVHRLGAPRRARRNCDNHLAPVNGATPEPAELTGRRAPPRHPVTPRRRRNSSMIANRRLPSSSAS